MGVAVFAGMIGVTALRPLPHAGVLRAAAPMTGNRPLKQHGDVPHLDAPRRSAAAVRGRRSTATRAAAPTARATLRLTMSPMKDHLLSFDQARWRARSRCSPRWCWPAARRRRLTTPHAAPAAPAAFKEARRRAGLRSQPAEAQPRGEWWKAFADPRARRPDRARRSQQHQHPGSPRRASRRRGRWLRATDAERAPQIGLAAGAVRRP